MTNTADGKRDFFVSFSQADGAWAEWVGAMLEQAGYTVLLDVWDVTGNFGAQMQGQRMKEGLLPGQAMPSVRDGLPCHEPRIGCRVTRKGLLAAMVILLWA